ncbi:MAG: threonine/serine exporter family protein [Hungatella sp.]
MAVAMQAGHILLENGAEIFRVEETISRICRYYGITSHNVFTLSNGIFVTGGSTQEQYFAEVQHIPVSSSHLDRVAAVNQLSREIEDGRYTIEEVEACLERIRMMPGKTKKAQVIAAGIGSAAFCYLYGGSFYDSAAAFLAGLALYVFVLQVSKPHLSKIVGSIMGGAFATLACVILYYLGIGQHLNQMTIGAIIPLVPGVAFTNAIRDIADENYISGSVRMLDALLVFFCIAMGVGLVFTVFHRITGGIML